jgi:hypothetical protein
MKKLLVLASLGAAFAVQGTTSAAVNAPVNIAYPISMSTVNNYYRVSFSATCPGGPRTVTWSVDGIQKGQANFYDNFSGQYLHKSGSGWHTLEVAASCGTEFVQFFVN